MPLRRCRVAENWRENMAFAAKSTKDGGTDGKVGEQPNYVFQNNIIAVTGKEEK